MLTTLTAEGHAPMRSDAYGIVVEEFNFSRRLVGGLEVAEDEVTEVPACTVGPPDDEARPHIVVITTDRRISSSALPSTNILERKTYSPSPLQ